MEGPDFQYRNLIVWQKSMRFSKLVYQFVHGVPMEVYPTRRVPLYSTPHSIRQGYGGLAKSKKMRNG